MTLRRLFKTSRADKTPIEPVLHVSTAYVTESPKIITNFVAQHGSPRLDKTHSIEAEAESEKIDDDADGLDSFISDYYGEFSLRMVRDAASDSDIRDRVCQVLRQRPKIKITAAAVEEAARIFDHDMISLLLETQRNKVHLTWKVIEAAVSNEKFGVEIMRIFQQRCVPIRITKGVVVAAYWNNGCGKDIIIQLLRDTKTFIGGRGAEAITQAFDAEVMCLLLGLNRPNIRITERVTEAAARNSHSGKQVLELFFEHNFEIRATEHIAIAAAGNEEAGIEILLLFIDHGLDIPVTEEVWQVAAGNERNGIEILDLLLEHQGRAWNSEKVIVAAAANAKSGKQIIDLLIEHGDELEITEEIIQAAAENKGHGKEILDLLLDKSKTDIQFTERIVPSFISSSLNDPLDPPWRKRVQWGMYEAISQILQGIHKARIRFTAKAMAEIVRQGRFDLIFHLLDMHGGGIFITEEVIEAAAARKLLGPETMLRLLEHTPAVRLTERAVVLAAGMEIFGKDLLEIFFSKRNGEIRVTPEAIEAAVASEYSPQETLKILLEHSPTVQITEEAIAVAAANDLYATKIFDLLISKCKGEVRVILQRNYNSDMTVVMDFIKQLLRRNHAVSFIGPAVDDAVLLDDPELVTLLLKKQGNKKYLSTRAVERAAGNKYSGKEIMSLFLNHGSIIEVTEAVVQNAAKNTYEGREMMHLLLCNEREKVRVSETGVEAIARLFPPEIVSLLLETRKDDIKITTRMIEAAASNNSGAMALLFEHMAEAPPVTDGIIEAAASNADVLRWLFGKYGPEVEITQKAVEIAAGHSVWSLRPLLEQWGNQIYITTKVMEAVASSLTVCDTVRMLLDMRPCEAYMTEDFWIAVVGGEYGWNAGEVVEQLSEHCNNILITEGLVSVAAKQGKHTMSMLLRYGKASVTAKGVQAIAKWFDQEILSLLLDLHGHYIRVTERVLEAAAENLHSGFEVVELLIRERGDETLTWSVERSVEAAARNPRDGKEIMELLLCEFPHFRFVTEEVIIAAAGNKDKSMGEKIIELLLNQREDEVLVTEAVMEATAANSLGERITTELQLLFNKPR